MQLACIKFRDLTGWLPDSSSVELMNARLASDDYGFVINIFQLRSPQLGVMSMSSYMPMVLQRVAMQSKKKLDTKRKANARQAKEPALGATAPGNAGPRLAFASSLIALIAITYAFWSDREYSKRLQALRTGHSNALLLVQQVDALSQEYLLHSNPSSEPGGDGQSSLRTWLRFDSQFVEENRGDAQMRFEVAVALGRIGVAQMMLRENTASLAAFDEAGVLFSDLQRDYPENFLYRHEESAIWMHKAELNTRVGRLDEARAECQQALDLLAVNDGPRSDERDESLKTILGELLHLATAMHAVELSEAIATARLEALERLSTDHAHDVEFQRTLEDARRQKEDGFNRGG